MVSLLSSLLCTAIAAPYDPVLLPASQWPRVRSTNGAIHVTLHATPLHLGPATCILISAHACISSRLTSSQPCRHRSWSPPSLLRSSREYVLLVKSGMAASKGARKSLVSRTLERCRSGLARGGGKVSAGTAPGCFSVYVGQERERFVVRADRANHPLFRRLLDDAEREYGYTAQGPLVLPCSVDAFLDILWHMDNDEDQEHDDAVASPICGMPRGGSKGRAAGYRVLSPANSSPASFFFSPRASPATTTDGKRR
uniref:Uncharacterized protein n=1 Tax=Avena sativa TaxID=4498 RepID=A0ACD5XG49_AVESA